MSDKQDILKLPHRKNIFDFTNLYRWCSQKYTDRNPSKPETLTHCWFNVGPASEAVVQHQTNTGSMACIC